MNKQVYPISYWSAPPNTREHWADVAACGFTVAQIMAETPEVGRQVLDWCAELGMYGIVVDHRIQRDMPTQPGWEDVVQAVINDYGSHPALWAYYVNDEPGLDGFANLAAINQAFLERDPDHLPFINLFPNYASPAQLGTVSYDEHLKRYLETVQPQLLSYDHYALLEGNVDRPQYFPNLESIRAAALAADVPFMNIVLSTPHFNYRDPSPEDLRWQAYTTLAYGGKGIGWFTYVTPDVENYRNGPLSIYYQKTAKWEALRQVNLEIGKLGPWMLKLTSTGVYHAGAPVPGTTPLSGASVVLSVEGGELLIGEYQDEDGLPWVLAMNKDRERSCFVTLTLRTQHKALAEVARSTGALRSIARDQGVEAGEVFADGMVVRFWLAPADARLMRLSE